MCYFQRNQNRCRRPSKLEFKYDYLGRRVKKEESDWSGSAFNLVERYRFVYDGFNLITELNVDVNTSTVSWNRSFLWGLDESGTTQGAGGVGGLLMIVDGPDDKYLPIYDGSGNLTALLDEADGSVAVAYVPSAATSGEAPYGPFGEPLRATGDYAESNPFRFSTKYTDTESGLVYFGFISIP